MTASQRDQREGAPALLHLGAGTFEYVDEGEGHPTLFVHGGLGDHRTWAAVFRALENAPLRRLAVTQRGFGRRWAAAPPANFGIGVHAADLIHFIAALDLKPVALVAWSYGADVALQALAMRPDLFSRVVAYEPGDWRYLDPAERSEVAEEASRIFGPVFAAFGRGEVELAACRLMNGVAGAEDYFARQDDHARVVQLENAYSLTGQLAQQPAPDLDVEALASIKVPVLIGWGSQSPASFRKPSAAVGAFFPGAQGQEVLGAGHLWPIEEPVGFAAWVLNALASVR